MSVAFHWERSTVIVVRWIWTHPVLAVLPDLEQTVVSVLVLVWFQGRNVFALESVIWAPVSLCVWWSARIITLITAITTLPLTSPRCFKGIRQHRVLASQIVQCLLLSGSQVVFCTIRWNDVCFIRDRLSSQSQRRVWHHYSPAAKVGHAVRKLQHRRSRHRQLRVDQDVRFKDGRYDGECWRGDVLWESVCLQWRAGCWFGILATSVACFAS